MQRKRMYYDNKNAPLSQRVHHERGFRESLGEARKRRQDPEAWLEAGLHHSPAATAKYLAGEQKAGPVGGKGGKRRIRFPWL